MELFLSDLSRSLSSDSPPSKSQMLAFYDMLLPFYDLALIQTGVEAKIAQKRLKSILDQLESLIISLPD